MGALIVFDRTNPKSFLSAGKWKEEVQQNFNKRILMYQKVQLFKTKFFVVVGWRQMQFTRRPTGPLSVGDEQEWSQKGFEVRIENKFFSPSTTNTKINSDNP